MRSLLFSAMQPTGILHLGNYLGALKQFAALQSVHPCVFSIADLHAMTVPYDKDQLLQQVRSVAAAFLACGLDPKRHIIFRQSAVSAHAEMAWILNCTARMGWLERMTQFKEKAGKSRERASVGLYAYPVLMAADILAYRATHVPVGEDQTQHLELARDIARKFNQDFAGGESFFPLPEACLMDNAARIMSLRDASKKMSKSDPSPMSFIALADSEEEIAKKIQRATTDPLPLPDNEKALQKRPEARNLIAILAALSSEETPRLLRRMGGRGFSDLKKELTERLQAELRPIRAAIKDHLSDPKNLDETLQEGAERARQKADPILKETKRAIGLIPRD